VLKPGGIGVKGLMTSVSVFVVHTSVFGLNLAQGNPGPIVLGGDLLDPGQMLALAKRLNADTTFVLSPVHQQATIRLRYFVPDHEMELSIHATVGAITVLVEYNRLRKPPASVETALGMINADWQMVEAGNLFVLVDQFPPTFVSHTPARAEVANALRIPESAILDQINPIQSVSTARAKLIIPLSDSQTLDELQPDIELL